MLNSPVLHLQGFDLCLCANVRVMGVFGCLFVCVCVFFVFVCVFVWVPACLYVCFVSRYWLRGSDTPSGRLIRGLNPE